MDGARRRRPTENFLVAPTVGDVYVYDDLRYDPATRGYYFADLESATRTPPRRNIIGTGTNGHEAHAS